MKYLPSLLFLSILFSCQENKPAAPPPPAPEVEIADDFLIVPGQRVGLITTENCSPDGILKAYGERAKVDSVYLGEGMEDIGVVLFPDDEHNRVEIYWDKERSPKYPTFIHMRGDSTGTDWKTKEGITIGTPMTDVEKLHGGPFKLLGFGWDYGGFVSEWGEGQFNASLGLRFVETAEGASGEIYGERVISSNAPDVVAAKPVVSMLQPHLLAKEKLPECMMEMIEKYSGRGQIRIQKMAVNGTHHYWFNDGAAAYDGIEFIYNEKCREVCKIGGFRKELDCMKLYGDGAWELVWEE